ncbi:hypothetical protein JR316_0004862 [Psilocybe cubensis]|uniref:Uncharacterized protein n=2 Tax=Psilocybe cubensis TaxID=181762 RepID=A0A8H8CLE1_PSICU|nr:hypothetical protein JR316_0004862 [Psilocybe cubensis]KAH9482762.1 hypothetical protein JR316_0004862 [Psilocybe cubensis]
MSLPDTTEQNSFKEEIVELARTLAEIQSRLQQLALRLEEKEKHSEISGRCRELEESLKVAVNSAKWLNAQNKDLQFRLDQSRPEIDRLLIARESACKRLKHARKVIRDLLEERGDMSSPRTQGSLSQGEINEALNDDFRPDDSSSSSNDSASDKTVRLNKTPLVELTNPISPSSEGIVSHFPLGRSPITLHTNTTTHSKNATPSTPRSRSTLSFRTGNTSSSNLQSPQRPSSVTHNSSPNSSTESPGRWLIQYTKPPGSRALEVPHPVQSDVLQEFLNLDEDAMQSLQGTMTSSDISMRLHIVRLPIQHSVAFLYDPIFAETRQLKSYIVDWGRQQTNQNIERYILQHKEVDPVFEVFIFPIRQQKWYYVGPMEWSVVEGKEVWQGLQGKDRTKIISKLCKRSRGQVNGNEMEKLLDEAELHQICVEMKGVKDKHEFEERVFGSRPALLEDLRPTERSA